MPHLFATTRSEAVFSDCGNFRFWLCREWGVAEKFGVFFLCNPSCADALWGDQTATRCNNLAVHWGWRGFGIVNLNPMITPSMTKARAASIPDLMRDRNDTWIKRAHQKADVFVVATGAECHGQTIAEIERLESPAPFYAIHKNLGDGLLHPSKPFDEKTFAAPIPIDPV